MSLSEADLTWQPSTDVGTGVAGYRIYRDGVEIASTSVASYSATQLVPETSYTFTVNAYDLATQRLSVMQAQRAELDVAIAELTAELAEAEARGLISRRAA